LRYDEGRVLDGTRKTIGQAYAREWTQLLSHYHEPNHAFSVIELAITAGAFIALGS
jgi:hypothetical protein